MEKNGDDRLPETIMDIITGERIPLIGAEENRQAVIGRLMTQKGYAKDDIKRAVPIEVLVGAESYRSLVDLVVAVNGKTIMVIKCAAGSLGSREREVLSAARLLEPLPIALSVVSDGVAAIVLDTVSGKIIGKNWSDIPARAEALKRLATQTVAPLPPEKRQKEALIFRSYDSMIVNRLNHQ